MRRIGIGVITTLNRKLHPNLINLISQPVTIHIEADTARRGPAFARNQCIKALYDSGVTDFFLFDDDVYPIQLGWEDYLIKAAEGAGVHCMSYPDPSVSHLTGGIGEIEFWQFNTGCFKYLTRHAIDTIGYFNEAYRTYGHEDVAYLYRARKAGLTGSPSDDAAPARLPEFIRSIDIYGKDLVDEYKPWANMSQQEKLDAIEMNRPAFFTETTNHEIYYPYPENR